MKISYQRFAGRVVELLEAYLARQNDSDDDDDDDVDDEESKDRLTQWVIQAVVAVPDNTLPYPSTTVTTDILDDKNATIDNKEPKDEDGNVSKSHDSATSVADTATPLTKSESLVCMSSPSLSSSTWSLISPRNGLSSPLHFQKSLSKDLPSPPLPLSPEPHSRRNSLPRMQKRPSVNNATNNKNSMVAVNNKDDDDGASVASYYTEESVHSSSDFTEESIHSSSSSSYYTEESVESSSDSDDDDNDDNDDENDDDDDDENDDNEEAGDGDCDDNEKNDNKNNDDDNNAGEVDIVEEILLNDDVVEEVIDDDVVEEVILDDGKSAAGPITCIFPPTKPAVKSRVAAPKMETIPE
ncbi:hypothetical protein ACA910_011557 [Epithemia clementina (nom. ined.)]